MSMNRPDLGTTPSRRRRQAEVEERVQADVQKEELRQLNVAVPLGLHRQMRLRAARGHHPAGAEHPGHPVLPAELATSNGRDIAS